MKRILFAVLLILAVLPGASTLPALVATTQAPAAAISTLEAALKELEPALAADFAKDGLAGASIGVVSGSKLVWSRHFGYADVEAKRVPTNDSAYRIGSITKQFTALALLQLAEHEKLRLTDPVEKYVPEIKSVQKAHAGSPPITLLQVATMMSGLAREPLRDCQDHSAGPVSGWQKKVLDCLPKTEYAFEPGTQYLYSNIGYATLGVAIERAAGHPFTSVVEQHTLKPLGMSRTAFEPTPEIRKDLAHGYIRREGKPDRTAPDRELDGRGYRVPNGALFSTINDLAKFVAWELGEGPAGVLKKETQDANYTRTYSANGSLSSGYGLGFMLSRRGDVVMLGHGGSTAGYRASALVNRQAKLGVIVLRNAEPAGANQPSFDAGGIASRMLEAIVTATRPKR